MLADRNLFLATKKCEYAIDMLSFFYEEKEMKYKIYIQTNDDVICYGLNSLDEIFKVMPDKFISISIYVYNKDVKAYKYLGEII